MYLMFIFGANLLPVQFFSYQIKSVVENSAVHTSEKSIGASQRVSLKHIVIVDDFSHVPIRY